MQRKICSVVKFQLGKLALSNLFHFPFSDKWAIIIGFSSVAKWPCEVVQPSLSLSIYTGIRFFLRNPISYMK